MYFWELTVLDHNRIARALADTMDARGEMAPLVTLEQAVFLADRRNALALRYLIIQAVEAMVDVCQHILARTRGILCEDYVDCLRKAGEQKIISTALAQKLRWLAALRNTLVHRYQVIDDKRLYEETPAGQNDLTAFVQEIEAFVQKSSSLPPTSEAPDTAGKPAPPQT
jgi:uncharacterized protein YutE (UPF0331/DUF86 family)